MGNTTNNRTNRGFTLVEIMVAVAVFVFIVAIISGLFLYAIKIQRRLLAQQELLDQTSYVMEYMSRGLRMAKKAEDGSCIPVGSNYQITYSGQGVKFISSDPAGSPVDECREFFLSGGQVQEIRAGKNDAITSSAMEIKTFKIVVAGDLADDPGNNSQPRVTVLLEVQRKGSKPELKPAVRLQTTVSQRNLDL